MNLWHVIHTYNELAKDGKVGGLLCPDDLCPLYVIIDPTDPSEEPVPALQCPQCHTMTRPGLQFWHQVRRAVLEYISVEQLDG